MKVFNKSSLKKILIPCFIIFSTMFHSCSYLDIVPDNIATLEYAFRLRSQAEKYLFTCYSYLPERGNWAQDPAMLSGDEVWLFYPYEIAFYGAPPSNLEIARGNQNVVSPYLNYWDGKNRGKPLFEAIRDCNIFLENIDNVPDLEDYERERWRSEVLFLKAYYHWYLLRMYGPIPIIDENKPVSAGVEEVKLYRQPVDSVINYIVELLDLAAENLPNQITDQISELGRVTKPAAVSLKARVLIHAASPLFNGNNDFSNLTGEDGQPLFNTEYDENKWKTAAKAAKDAIVLNEELGATLYTFQPNVNLYKIGPELQTQMDNRNVMADKWNKEIIWANTKPLVNNMQRYAQPILDPNGNISSGSKRPYGEFAPTLRVAEMFYSKNGVPIDEDKTFDFRNRYSLDTASADEKLFIKPGYVTAKLNFDREPRFYADLGFDGGMWYGQGKYDEDDMWHIEGKKGQYSGQRREGEYSITGYYCKKIVNFLNVLQTDGTYQIEQYPFPFIRLADLYLYYAEALNEYEGPTGEALEYINRIRERAGIPSVEKAWTNFSNNPSKYTTKEGFREIIHRERLIEMAFEGNRFWDLKRWKKAEEIMNQPIQGWSVDREDVLGYYQVKTLFNQRFKKKDYFWPIREQTLIINHNLDQNIGW